MRALPASVACGCVRVHETEHRHSLGRRQRSTGDARQTWRGDPRCLAEEVSNPGLAGTGRCSNGNGLGYALLIIKEGGFLVFGLRYLSGLVGLTLLPHALFA